MTTLSVWKMNELKLSVMLVMYKFEAAAKAFNMIVSTQKTHFLTGLRELRCKLAMYNVN